MISEKLRATFLVMWKPRLNTLLKALSKCIFQVKKQLFTSGLISLLFSHFLVMTEKYKNILMIYVTKISL